jgi:hypothetical protein
VRLTALVQYGSLVSLFYDRIRGQFRRQHSYSAAGAFEPAGLSLPEAAVVDLKWFGLQFAERSLLLKIPSGKPHRA